MTEKLPALVDFSQKNLDSAVRHKSNNNPVTLGTGVAGVGAFVLGAAWFGSSLPFWLIGLGGVALVGAGGNFLLDRTARRTGYIAKLVTERRQWLDKEVDRLASRLRQEFQQRDLHKPLSQLTELESSYRDLQDLVNSRFSDRGLTKDRFLGNAQQLRETALERLALIVDELDAVESIPVQDLRKRLQSGKLTEVEETSIKERLGHYDSAQDTIRTYQDDVEQALARISRISTQIPKVGADDDSFTRYLLEMERLADGVSAFEREV